MNIDYLMMVLFKIWGTAVIVGGWIFLSAGFFHILQLVWKIKG